MLCTAPAAPHPHLSRATQRPDAPADSANQPRPGRAPHLTRPRPRIQGRPCLRPRHRAPAPAPCGRDARAKLTPAPKVGADRRQTGQRGRGWVGNGRGEARGAGAGGRGNASPPRIRCVYFKNIATFEDMAHARRLFHESPFSGISPGRTSQRWFKHAGPSSGSCSCPAFR